MNNKSSKYLIGIDLGTTHTVIAYSDPSKGLERSSPALFGIAQLVAPGEVAEKPMLPSFRYHPAKGELSPGDLLLPWSSDQLPGEIEPLVIGEWARELGSKVDGRLVSSAKSWLSHPKIDRSQPILPWGSGEGVEKVSPVLASASYLRYLRQAWNHRYPNHPMETQEVVITIPASFDEAARALTVEAAMLAGLPNILLLEEPQAVCYDWHMRNKAKAADILRDARLLLVCDVGGGTTDLSLIRVAIEQGELALTRVGVGDHLMLGGDNVDLALAHLAEQRIVGDGAKLSAGGLSQLIQQSRAAKETLLADQPPESAKVTVLGSGARLIGGARSCELSLGEVRTLALDGFFPEIDFDTRPDRRRGAIVEFGLPYAADPAVSKHIAAFLSQHAMVCREALQMPEDSECAAVPDAVLFNGGVFNSPALKARALATLGNWAGSPVLELANESPQLAVARGAVAYSLARRGAQPKIGGGSARSYFLSLDGGREQQQGVCLLPKGTEENREIHLEQRKFVLRLGQPVQFHLLSSSADRPCKAAELYTLNEQDYISLPPLVAALDKSFGQTDEVEVTLVSRLTEVGTLKLECVNRQDAAQRWEMEFQIRKDMARLRRGMAAEIPGLPERFETARSQLLSVFGPKKKSFDPQTVKRLRRDLERTQGKLERWELPPLRAMFDQLMNEQKHRRRSEEHERVWYNLAGFGLRPGFGYPADGWRIEQIWPLFDKGLQYSKQAQSWASWWTFWRRAAGGLQQPQQQRIFDSIAPFIDPSNPTHRKRPAKLQQLAYPDMVRLAGSLENLPVATKIELGGWLIQRLHKASETQVSWWALGRIAAREPFHSSAHNVVPAETASRWLSAILDQDWKQNQNAAFAAVMIGRKTGDRSRDLSEQNNKTIIDRLKAARLPDAWSRIVLEATELEDSEVKKIYGEKLPSGLKLIQ